MNWGWRPGGGISWRGFTKGMLACGEVLIHKWGADVPVIQGSMAALGMQGLHEFRLYKKWLRMHMKEFMLDTILSRSSKDCGIFDFPVLSRMLDDYFAGRRRVYTEIVAALDLA